MIYHLVFYLCTCVMLGITHFTRTAYVHDRSPFHRQYVADGGQITTLAWAVALKPHQVVSMETLVHNIARDVGLVCHGQIGELRGHFLFSFNPLSTDINVWNELNNTTIKNNVTEVSVNGSMDSFMFNYGAVKKYVENKLRSHLLVESFHQQVFRKRVKRSLEFLDPLFPKQWHLVNTKDHWKDINVSGVWEFNITGRGVTVCVVDDGIPAYPDSFHSQDISTVEGRWVIPQLSISCCFVCHSLCILCHCLRSCDRLSQ